MSIISDEDAFIENDYYDYSSSEYVSPLLRKLESTRLTVELLQELIPIVREGEAADQKLKSEITLKEAEARQAKRAVRAGEKAKERLFNAALPLIKSIAKKEYHRRQQWGSQILMDDLVQDATIGFFKGLRNFDVSAIRKSATNYLGQWMLSEMRRAAESMDHDLQVGHDAGERYRRIRAIRSRLSGELGREPTDEEVAEASSKPEYVMRPGMVGKVKDASNHSIRGLSLSQIQDEREHRERLGITSRIDNGESESENGNFPDYDVLDFGRTEISGQEDSFTDDPANVVGKSENFVIVADIVQRVIDALSLPEQQREIISRRYGLEPYEEEESARSISRAMNIHREKISRVLSAFATEMTGPGATLHQILRDFSTEELYDLGLGWLADTLGPWDDNFDSEPHRPNPELTRSISSKKSAS